MVSQKNDIYVSHEDDSTSKLSFHESGICRSAFTSEYGVPVTMGDRVMSKWLRADVPPAGSGRACLLLRIWIATDFLSTNRVRPTKRVCWIPAASIGSGRVIYLVLTKYDEQELVSAIGLNESLIAYKRLPNGDAAAVWSAVVDGSEKDFAVVTNHQSPKRQLLISSNDTSARPVHFISGNRPKDHDAKELWEFSGSYVDGPLPEGIGIFRMDTVLANQNTTTRKQDMALGNTAAHYLQWPKKHDP